MNDLIDSLILADMIRMGLIQAGGPGSGCKGDQCGRPRTGKDADRIAKAKASYKPSTKAKQIQAEQNEKRLAQAIQGLHLGDHQPFDVVISSKRIGIEVKTLLDNKRDAITMHPKSLAKKYKAIKTMKLKAAYTVIFDDRPGRGQIFLAKGVGSFRVYSHATKTLNKNLVQVKDLNDLRKLL